MTGKVIAKHDTPEGPRYDVEFEDGTVRRNLAGDEVDEDEDGEAEVEAKTPAPKSAAAAEAKFFQYDLEFGVVTVNEYRAAKGLPSDARFGSMTWPEYVAQEAATYKAAAQARSAGGAA